MPSLQGNNSANLHDYFNSLNEKSETHRVGLFCFRDFFSNEFRENIVINDFFVKLGLEERGEKDRVIKQIISENVVLRHIDFKILLNHFYQNFLKPLFIFQIRESIVKNTYYFIRPQVSQLFMRRNALRIRP